MKKNVTKVILSVVMSIIFFSTMIVPAQAATKYTANTIEITTKYGESRTYTTYDTPEEAEAHPIVFHANKNDFPIKVAISSRDYSTNKYTFKSYGIKNVSDDCANLYGYWKTYATIDIEPYQKTTTLYSGITTTQTKELSEEEKAAQLIDDKLDQLMKELNLGFYNDSKTPYGEELKAFLAGEWDGHRIEADSKDNYVGYIATRSVRNRTYRWSGTNLRTGETRTREINVDYLGYLEVIPGPTTSQKFSFAVSRTNGTFEQWCLLDKIDSWVLPEDAGTVGNIYLIGENSGNKDECQAIVYTTRYDEQTDSYSEHLYSLFPGGIVKADF